MMKVDFENVMRCMNFFVATTSLYQSRKLHDKELMQSEKHHEENITLQNNLHIENMKLNKKNYLIELFITLEQHFQQLNADLVGTSRESERDMFDQRNQQLQTIILSASVMFSALSTVIIQGPLSSQSSEFLIICYSLTTSLSFAFLFITIVICIEVVMRASTFMYHRSYKQTRNLRKAVSNTRTILKYLRKKADPNNHNNSTKSIINNIDNRNINALINDNNEAFVEISKMTNDEIKVQWEQHESFVHDFLRKRETIIDTNAIQITKNSKFNLVYTFDTYWNEKCKFWADLSTLMFYGGSLTLSLAIMIFMWSEFFFDYESTISASFAVIIIGVSLFFGTVFGIYLRSTHIIKKFWSKKSKIDDSSNSEHNYYDIDEEIHDNNDNDDEDEDEFNDDEIEESVRAHGESQSQRRRRR